MNKYRFEYHELYGNGLYRKVLKDLYTSLHKPYSPYRRQLSTFSPYHLIIVHPEQKG